MLITCPVCVSECYFFAISERRVVFPAPEGPMIASICPGLQYPVTLLRIFLDLTDAEIDFHMICTG